MSAVSEKYQRLWALEQLVADPELSFDDLERILEAFPEEELEPLQARVFLRALEDHIGTHRINSHTAMILRSLEAVLPLRVPHGERLVPPPNLHTDVSTHAAMEALRAAGQENFAEREQIVLSFFPEPTAQELEVFKELREVAANPRRKAHRIVNPRRRQIQTQLTEYAAALRSSLGPTFLQGLGRVRGELAGIGGADPLLGALAAGTSAQAEVGQPLSRGPGVIRPWRSPTATPGPLPREPAPAGPSAALQVTPQARRAEAVFDPDSLPPLKKVTPEYGQRRKKTPWTAREEDVLLKYCQHPMYKAGNWRMIKDHDRVNGNHLFDRSIVDLKDKWRNMLRHDPSLARFHKKYLGRADPPAQDYADTPPTSGTHGRFLEE
ncbi:hypothetical protein F751_2424 [Auxenochlorella protothecoides]|uniref:Uncharacterized protein n=1 Tax=Auxenochlorella protothecoides TaxID=3075 RepID=A0A087SG52_AUXPR|nr:hypothetical protein F751_2424 [Auxenochlorella protothecoides]KFM24706.1 hypothetical protein F751_2424 [Auxenochlorella protothecoides]